MARNINSDHPPMPGEFYPILSAGDRKMIATKLTPEKRDEALKEVLRECEPKTAGLDEALCTLPQGSAVTEGLVLEGTMLTEPASKEEAIAKEPTLMESLIDLSAAIQENEGLAISKAPAPKEPASKDLTLKEPMPVDLLIDLSAEGVAVHDWVKAGVKQLSTTPKELTPKENTPMDLLVELSAEERAGTLHSVIREQDWLVPKETARKEATRKEPAPKGPARKEAPRKEPARKESTPKEPAFEEPACKEPAPKEPTRNEHTLKETAAKESARKESTRKEPPRREPTRTEPTRKEPTPKEPTRKEPTRKEPTRKEPTRKEPIPKEPAFKEPIPKEPAFKEPIPKEPAFKEPTPMGTLIDLSNVPRTKVAALPPMLHGIRHLLGIQRTHERAVPVFSAIPALVPVKIYDYPSPASVPAKYPAAKYSSTPAPPHTHSQSSIPPPHMRILSMAERAATPPHMRTPSEKSSLTRSLSPVSSSSRSPSLAPVVTEPAKPVLDQSGRYLLDWEDEVPDYAWVDGVQRREEREW